MREFFLEIIAPGKVLFHGQIEKLFAIASLGELEILHGHLPTLAVLRPGPVYCYSSRGEEIFYLSGGLLAVQAEKTIILAHTAIRSQELDETKVLMAKLQAEQALAQKNIAFDYERAQTELVEAVAQLKLLKKLRMKK